MTQNTLAQAKLRLAMFAGVSMLAMAPAAHAVVVTYSGPPLAVTNDINGLYVNVVTGATGSAIAPAGWDFNVYNNNAGLTFFTRSADTANAYVGTGTGLTAAVAALPLGTTIGGGSSYASLGQVQGLAFQTPGNRYFGFRFTNEAGGTTHYGYALLSSGATVGFPASIISYAFESTPNLPITIPVPIPEPGTYALMALGLVAVGGIAARRRKAVTTA